MQGRSPTPGLIQSSQTPAVGRVDLNTASQEELENLPGVGLKLAERIIAARQQRPFTSLAALDQVPGIGPFEVSANRSSLLVDFYPNVPGVL